MSANFHREHGGGAGFPFHVVKDTSEALGLGRQDTCPFLVGTLSSWLLLVNTSRGRIKQDFADGARKIQSNRSDSWRQNPQECPMLSPFHCNLTPRPPPAQHLWPLFYAQLSESPQARLDGGSSGYCNNFRAERAATEGRRTFLSPPSPKCQNPVRPNRTLSLPLSCLVSKHKKGSEHPQSPQDSRRILWL